MSDFPRRAAITLKGRKSFINKEGGLIHDLPSKKPMLLASTFGEPSNLTFWISKFSFLSIASSVFGEK